MPAMKTLLSIASVLFVGMALTLTACGKNKNQAKTDPAKTAPAAAEPAAADPTAEAPKAEDPPKAEPSKGGW
jgi:ABC-type oligopeptide transport system substrate-binding subunit